MEIYVSPPICLYLKDAQASFCYTHVVKANKTQPTAVSVDDYLASIDNEQRREDATRLVRIMTEATGLDAVMWGPSIVGFGNYHYVYSSGREGDTPVVSFSARKNALTLYGVMFYEQNENNMKLTGKLGPHTHGKGCLYIKTLNDIDADVLKTMIHNAFQARPHTD